MYLTVRFVGLGDNVIAPTGIGERLNPSLFGRASQVVVQGSSSKAE